MEDKISKDIITFIKDWNHKYPIDYWWRRKHKIPFNSKLHKEQSLLDMRIEYEEDFLYGEYLDSEIEKAKNGINSEKKYIPGHGSIFKKLKKVKMSEKDMEDLFDEIDISRIEKNEDGSIKIGG